MRHLYITVFKKSWLALFIIGFLTGSSATVLQTGKELDRLHILNNRLQGELTDKETQLKALNTKLQDKKAHVVEKTTLHIKLPDETWASHEAVQETLEQEIKKILTPLLGHPVEQIDPEVVHSLLHQRIISTNQGEFALDMKWLIISTDLQVNIEAVPKKN